MKPVDWWMSFSFIAAGLACLAMASTGMAFSQPFQSFFGALFTICFWTAIPLVIVGLGYMIYKKR